MQHGVRRLVGEVVHIIGRSPRKLVARVKVGDLQHTFQVHAAQHRVAIEQKFVEVQKVGQQKGRDQQGGVQGVGVGVHQELHLSLQQLQDLLGVAEFGHHITHLTFGHHRLGKRAQVQTHHSAGQPQLGVFNGDALCLSGWWCAHGAWR